MRAKWTGALVVVTAIGVAGCEALVPLAISEATKGGDPDVAPFEAPLTVELESAQGTVDGRALSAEMLEPSGMRFGNSLQFEMQAPSEAVFLQLTVDSAESSSVNPYTGEGGGDFGGGRPVPPEAEPFPESGTVGGGSGAFLTACGDGVCRDATDLTVEIVQTADGREALVEGTWSGGDRISMTFRYVEAE